MKSAIVLVTRRFVVLLGIYSLLRLVFFIHNGPLFNGISFSDIGAAFVHGVRFDISAILIVNLLFFLVWLLPLHFLKTVFFQKLSFFLFVAVNFVFFTTNAADCELYNFNGKRITLDYFRLGQDIGGQAFSIIGYYWKLVLVAPILTAILFYFGKGSLDKQNNQDSWCLKLGTLLLFLALTVIGVRGGLQLKPLRPVQAYIFQQSHLGGLSLNSTFSLARGKSSTALTRLSYFPNRIDLESLLKGKYLNGKSKVELPLSGKIQNVVIILLESFAQEYTGGANLEVSYTPFLDELSQKSLSFSNHFANGRRSIEAIPSVLAEIPSLMGEPFITSSFQTNQVIGLGSILKNRGYHTSFFHGAENGTMFFDSFAHRLGFDHYIGLSQYPDPKKDFDGNWGVFDEPFLQYTVNELNQYKEPFLTVIFTLSSHHPYAIPQEHKNRFPKGTLEIHESIGYADYALNKFFESASTQSWYNNTLFVITGDHTQKSDSKKYQSLGGSFRVPLLIFHPSYDMTLLKEKVDVAKATQHVDILPSILDWLGIENKKRTYFGQSLFQPYSGRVFNFESGQTWLITDPQHIGIRSEHSQKKPLLKAVEQKFINGLLDNSWYE